MNNNTSTNINMDSSSQNWLGFSLSNHHHMSTINLSLFEAFNTPATPSVSVADATTQDQQEACRATTDLSIFTTTAEGPKLEDFLGGSTTAPPPPQPQQVQSQIGQLDQAPLTNNNYTTSTVCDNTSEIYDSELKTIAASFLRGVASNTTTTTLTAEQNDAAFKHPQILVHSDPAPKKTVDTFGQRTSIYRGVTRHRWTGRYEAHLWDNSCRREGQSRKGRQVYLGGYDKEEKAARAYDLAALKYWGPATTTNFPISNYEKELDEMKHMTRQEFVASLRRKSSGFSRGASIYRGVTRHHQHGRWQARIGRVAGNKDLYLGTFCTQEEAAEAYDIAAIKFRGLNAVTNFDMSRYDVKSIANSNLPIGGISGKSKNSAESVSDGKTIDGSRSDDWDLSSSSSVTFASPAPTSTLSFAIPIKQDPSTDYWSNILGTYQHKNTSNAGINVAQSCNIVNNGLQNPSTAFTMDHFNVISCLNDSNNSNNGLVLNVNGGCVRQQSNNGGGISVTSTSSSSIPFATPIALNSNYEGNSGNYGSWISQSLHSLQSAKANLSVFQTPIFGME